MEHVLFMCCKNIQAVNELHSSAQGMFKMWLMLAYG